MCDASLRGPGPDPHLVLTRVRLRFPPQVPNRLRRTPVPRLFHRSVPCTGQVVVDTIGSGGTGRTETTVYER